MPRYLKYNESEKLLGMSYQNKCSAIVFFEFNPVSWAEHIIPECHSIELLRSRLFVVALVLECETRDEAKNWTILEIMPRKFNKEWFDWNQSKESMLTFLISCIFAAESWSYRIDWKINDFLNFPDFYSKADQATDSEFREKRKKKI